MCRRPFSLAPATPPRSCWATCATRPSSVGATRRRCAAIAAGTCRWSAAPSSTACATAPCAGWWPPMPSSWAWTSASWVRWSSPATRAPLPRSDSRRVAPAAARRPAPWCWWPRPRRSTSTWRHTRAISSKARPSTPSSTPTTWPCSSATCAAPPSSCPLPPARASAVLATCTSCCRSWRKKVTCINPTGSTAGWPPSTRPKPFRCARPPTRRWSSRPAPTASVRW